MSDEDIIKRKLLIDGDGTGDDRRLNIFVKTLTKYVNSTDVSPEENKTMEDKLLTQLSICEHSVKKSRVLSKAMAKQIESYTKKQTEFEQMIQDIKDVINESKECLMQAKVWKQNHMMYDLLAQSIDEQPARKETNETMLSLQEELRMLNQENERLDQRLDMRRKQFHVLVQSAVWLQAMLEEVESDTENNLLDDVLEDSTGPEPMSE